MNKEKIQYYWHDKVKITKERKLTILICEGIEKSNNMD